MTVRKLSQLNDEDVDRMVAKKVAEAEAAQKARRERVERNDANAAWIAQGGDETSFEKEWPTLRDEARRRRVIGANEEARRVARARLRRNL
jgi:hypothetical protein